MDSGVRVQGSPKVEGTKDQALYYALSRAGKAWSSHILLPLPQTEPRGKAQAAVWYVTQRALSVTQRARSVTQQALSWCVVAGELTG
jgi:hypothetical protein